jgi:hypothetical protein
MNCPNGRSIPSKLIEQRTPPSRPSQIGVSATRRVIVLRDVTTLSHTALLDSPELFARSLVVDIIIRPSLDVVDNRLPDPDSRAFPDD